MSRHIIVDNKRGFAYNIHTGTVDIKEDLVFSEAAIPLADSIRVIESAETDDGGDSKIIVPEIIAMVEGISHNHRKYTSESMKRRRSNKQGSPSGVSSFTIPVGRPILINHQLEATPPYKPIVGRIRKAQYVKEGRDPNEPKAHIKIWPEITDPYAIESIENGEFLSVSIYATTEHLTCSICGTDIIEQMTNIVTKTKKKGGKEGVDFEELFLEAMDDEDGCTHMPGFKYDGKECYFTVGDFWVRETSFVTIPGIDQARVVKRNTMAAQESVEMDTSVKNRQIWPTIAFVSEADLLGDFEGSIITEAIEDKQEDIKEQTNNDEPVNEQVIGCERESKEMKITEELILKILGGEADASELESEDLAKLATVAKTKLAEANDSIEGYKSDLEAKDTKIAELEAEVEKVVSERDDFSSALKEMKDKTHQAAVDGFVAVLEGDLGRELDEEQRKAVEALDTSQLESLTGIIGEKSLDEEIKDLEQEDPGEGKEGITKPEDTAPEGSDDSKKDKNADQITAETFLKGLTS